MQSNEIDYHKNVILLIGNPNVGKTSIFNQLSRKYAITANYPFTTVELNIDAIKLHGKEFELIDGAGIYRLANPSEEGQLTRNIIFKHHPEIILQVIEASNLGRSLLLTAQLLELEIPVVIILNMIDEMVKQGIRVNSRLVSELLEVPVILIVEEPAIMVPPVMSRLPAIVWVASARVMVVPERVRLLTEFPSEV